MDFPALNVRDLEGVDHVIPHGLQGGPHVILLAFQQWHQSLVEQWKAPLGPIAEEYPGTEVWEVPSISKGYRLFRAGIDGGMRAGIPDADVRRHTLTAYTDLDELARDLELGSLETIHAFLVDCQGVILWRHEGPPTSQALEDLEHALQDATC